MSIGNTIIPSSDPLRPYITGPGGSGRSIADLVAEHRAYRRPVVRREPAGVGEIVLYGNTPAEEEVRLLSRLATQFRREGHIDEAISCLRRAYSIQCAMGSINSQPIQWWLRLPKFLAHAGRLDESRLQFGIVIEDIRVRQSRRPDLAHLCHGDRAQVFDAMRIVFQRAGRKFDAMRCRIVSDAYHVLWSRVPICRDEVSTWISYAVKSREDIRSRLEKLKLDAITVNRIVELFETFIRSPDEMSVLRLQHELANVLHN